MKNYAYMVHVTHSESDLSEASDELFLKCVESFFHHSGEESNLIIYTRPSQKNIDSIRNYPNVSIKYVDEELWSASKIGCKIKSIPHALLKIPEDANVLVLDSDLFFTGNPFEVFENSFDFFVTSRTCNLQIEDLITPYFKERGEEFITFLSSFEYNSKIFINGGVWGFVNNEAARSLLSLFVEQINRPSWDSFITFTSEENLASGRGSDAVGGGWWWRDQDFLNTVHIESKKERLSSVKIHTENYRYNYIPPIPMRFEYSPFPENRLHEEAKAQVEKLKNEGDLKIIHLCGLLKKLVNIQEW